MDTEVQPDKCEKCGEEDIIYFWVNGKWVCEICRVEVVYGNSE